MSDKNIDKLEKIKSHLRSHLAVNQTALADERTLLSYIRTALTFFVAGIGFFKFFTSIIIEVIGWIFIPTGVIILIIGFVRYKKIRDLVRELEDFIDKN